MSPTIKKWLYGAMPLVLGMWVLVSFSPERSASPAAEAINESYLSGLDQLIQEAESLTRIATATTQESELATLQQQLLNTRNQYKEIEYLAAYSDPDHINRFINGAPYLNLIPKRMPRLSW